MPPCLQGCPAATGRGWPAERPRPASRADSPGAGRSAIQIAKQCTRPERRKQPPASDLNGTASMRGPNIYPVRFPGGTGMSLTPGIAGGPRDPAGLLAPLPDRSSVRVPRLAIRSRRLAAFGQAGAAGRSATMGMPKFWSSSPQAGKQSRHLLRKATPGERKHACLTGVAILAVERLHVASSSVNGSPASVSEHSQIYGARRPLAHQPATVGGGPGHPAQYRHGSLPAGGSAAGDGRAAGTVRGAGDRARPR
jgi:hypothetical protein